MTQRLRVAALAVAVLSLSACATEKETTEEVSSSESRYAYLPPDETTSQDYWNDWDSQPDALDPFRIDDGWGDFGFGGDMEAGACRTTLEPIRTYTKSMEEAARIMQQNALGICFRSSAANAFRSCEVVSATVGNIECVTTDVWDDDLSQMSSQYNCTGTVTCSRARW